MSSNNDTSLLPAPMSIEAEEALIGAVLINPSAFRILAATVHPEDFYILRHSYIWQAFERQSQQDKAIDYLTTCVELQKMGQIDAIGGPAYLTELGNKTPTSMHGPVYAGMVKQAATRRRLLQATDQIRALALDEQLQLNEVMGQAQSLFLDVSSRVVEDRGCSMKTAMNDLLDVIESQAKTHTSLVGIPSGLTDLDDLMQGFQAQDLIILAGRPGAGKSALILNIALNAARAGHKVGLFLNEMSRQEACYRWLAMDSGVNSNKLKRAASLTAAHWDRMTHAIGKFSDLPIWIEDYPLKPLEMAAKCQWLKRTTGLDLVLFDGMYKQHADSGDLEDYKRYSQVAEANKTLAKMLDVPVVATHQLNRDLEDRKDKRPQLSDLRGSGRIEEEADVVMFLYRDAMYNDNTEFPNQADIIVAKNRDGSTGTVPTYFEKTLTKFMNTATTRVDLEDDRVIPMPKYPTDTTHAAKTAPGE
jgi:replicative DNA helicase